MRSKRVTYDMLLSKQLREYVDKIRERLALPLSETELRVLVERWALDLLGVASHVEQMEQEVRDLFVKVHLGGFPVQGAGTVVPELMQYR